MKKILTVSLGALLVVGAANAEIASVDYVDDVAGGKQNTITDLATIRSGAALGATAVQNLAGLGITATATELNYVDGVTSNIQTQLSGKQNAAQIGTVSAANMGTTATTVVTAINEVAGEAAAAQSTANTAQTTANSKQPKSTAAYQMGNASGGWTAMTSGQQNALNSGVTSTTVTQVATNTTNIARKQDALGYTAENTANKTQTIDADSTDTQYPSAKAVHLALDSKVKIKQGTNNAGKGLVVDGTNGELVLADIATQDELNRVASTAASGQTAAEVNTAITNAINTLDVTSVGEAGNFIITIAQENGKIAATTKSFVPNLVDGELDAPTTNAVYDALQGKLNTTGTAAKATADASGNVITTTYATKNELTTGLNGKQNSSLGSTNANKAVITDASGNITTGTITSGMIGGSTVTTGKIADGTIVNVDIASNAAIAQSKISGLTTALDGKQQVVSDGVEGKFYVADYGSGWKDMYEAMPKDEACNREDTKCALTHKAGKYSWEVVRE